MFVKAIGVLLVARSDTTCTSCSVIVLKESDSVTCAEPKEQVATVSNPKKNLFIFVSFII